MPEQVFCALNCDGVDVCRRPQQFHCQLHKVKELLGADELLTIRALAAVEVHTAALPAGHQGESPGSLPELWQVHLCFTDSFPAPLQCPQAKNCAFDSYTLPTICISNEFVAKSRKLRKDGTSGIDRLSR